MHRSCLALDPAAVAAERREAPKQDGTGITPMVN